MLIINKKEACSASTRLSAGVCCKACGAYLFPICLKLDIGDYSPAAMI
jgi:hypothetical protein